MGGVARHPLIESIQVHASDLISAYAKADFTDYVINFVNNLTPNAPDVNRPNWPQYSTSSPQLLTLQDDLLKPITMTQDTYRQDGIAFLNQLALAHPL